jgi:hypothetical protein
VGRIAVRIGAAPRALHERAGTARRTLPELTELSSDTGG